MTKTRLCNFLTHSVILVLIMRTSAVLHGRLAHWIKEVDYDVSLHEDVHVLSCGGNAVARDRSSGIIQPGRCRCVGTRTTGPATRQPSNCQYRHSHVVARFRWRYPAQEDARQRRPARKEVATVVEWLEVKILRPILSPIIRLRLCYWGCT